MATTTTYQCPNCSGRLVFDGSEGKLRCQFCESLFTAQEIEELYAAKQAEADAKVSEGHAHATSTATTSAAAASTSEAPRVQPAKTELTGDPIQDYIAQSKWSSSETDNLRAFNCPACGAQLLVDQVTAVTSCPYCGNNAVVPGQLSDVLKPDYVIPFKLDRDAAIAALKAFYGGKPLLPNNFTANNHIEEVQGVYVPFWLYTGTVDASASFDAMNMRTWSDSKNNYTDTDHFDLYRAGTMRFQGVPVDGSTKMPDAHMDAIEPFDYSEMVPFSVGYLPGYITDRYDLDVAQCNDRAIRRVGNTAAVEMEGTAHGYMEVNTLSHKEKVTWTHIAYALLPVWMLHTRWNGTDYLFAMNGQTGKLIGDLPIDKSKKTKRFLMMFLPIMIVLAVVIFGIFGIM